MSSDRILNINDVEFFDFGHGENYQCQRAPVSPRIGLTKIGCNVTIYAPGKAAFPFHAHRVNDELFFVMQGEGEIRIGKETHAIKEGDFIGLPADSGNAHQIKNTGTQPLKVLAFSSSMSPEVAEYPDHGKIGVLVGKPPMGKPDERSIRKFFKADDDVEYWDGVE